MKVGTRPSMGGAHPAGLQPAPLFDGVASKPKTEPSRPAAITSASLRIANPSGRERTAAHCGEGSGPGVNPTGQASRDDKPGLGKTHHDPCGRSSPNGLDPGDLLRSPRTK